jgi:hypothetical protein
MSNEMRLPSIKTLQEASKLAILEDRPLMLDYWLGSIQKNTMIGVNDSIENGVKVTEKLLVRNENEYTSPISKVFRVKTDILDKNTKEELIEYIIMTQRSIYIVDSKIPVRPISSETFKNDDDDA